MGRARHKECSRNVVRGCTSARTGRAQTRTAAHSTACTTGHPPALRSQIATGWPARGEKHSAQAYWRCPARRMGAQIRCTRPSGPRGCTGGGSRSASCVNVFCCVYPKVCCTAMQALWAQAVARGAKRVASSGARPISAACLHALPLAHGHRGGPSRRRLAPAALPVSTCCRQAAATICLRVHAICPCRHRRRAHARAMVRRGACTTEKRRTKKRGADFWRSGRVGGRGRLCEAVDGRAGNGICILLPFLDFVHASFERRLSVCLLASVHTRAYALRAGT